MRVRALATALMAVAWVGSFSGSQNFSSDDAASMEQKLQAILDRAALEPPPKNAPLVTPVSEAEVNAYLRLVAGPTLPVGVVDPTVRIADRGRLGVSANIDLDALRKSKPRGSLDPLAYVSGVVQVNLAGRLETGRGRGTFDLESATLAGVEVPESLVQELVTYLTKTEENPAGVSLGRPFDLPARIQQIRTTTGRATIVQ